MDEIVGDDAQVGAFREERAEIAAETARGANRRPEPRGPPRRPLELVERVALEQIADDLVFVAAR